MSEHTVVIHRYLEKLRSGDASARECLVNFTFERLQRMAKKMKHDFDRVGRWEQTDDIVQNATIRLLQAIDGVEIRDVRHFYRLAALQIRRELIDLCRHYHGPLGAAANHQTQRGRSDQTNGRPEFERAETISDPSSMQEWGEFHTSVNELPEQQREVFELVWYHELSQPEIAELLGISTRQVKRIWRSAKLSLYEQLNGEIPS